MTAAQAGCRDGRNHYTPCYVMEATHGK